MLKLGTSRKRGVTTVFGLGPTEIIIIVVLAFIILGPTAFPSFARSAGRTMRDLRSVKDDFTRELQDPLAESEERSARYRDLDDSDVKVYTTTRAAAQVDPPEAQAPPPTPDGEKAPDETDESPTPPPPA
ncbi:MAG: twin-arginine translocase TatA/TatE family subunit [Chloroflexota bacterium]|nr:twin-arginine translocase TatA/TatE family subunit [Chloroflexota bacterium]